MSPGIVSGDLLDYSTSNWELLDDDDFINIITDADALV